MTSPYRWIGPTSSAPDEDEEERRRKGYTWIGPKPGSVEPRPPSIWERVKSGQTSGARDFRSGGGASGPAIRFSDEQKAERQGVRLERARNAGAVEQGVAAFGRGLTAPFDNLFQSEEDRANEDEAYAAMPEPTTTLGKVGRVGAEVLGGFAPYVAASIIGTPAAAAGLASAGSKSIPIVSRVARFLGQSKARTSWATGVAVAAPVNALQAVNPETSSATFIGGLEDVEGEGVGAQVARRLGALGQKASETYLGRLATEQALDMGLGAVFEGAATPFRNRAARKDALGQARARFERGGENMRVLESLDPNRAQVQVDWTPTPAPPEQITLPRRPIPSAMDEYAPIVAGTPQIPQLQAPRPGAVGAEVVPPLAGRRPQVLDELPVEPVRPAVDRTPIEPEVIEARPYAPPAGFETMGPTQVFKEGQRAAAELGVKQPSTVAQARGLLREIAGTSGQVPTVTPPKRYRDRADGRGIVPDLGTEGRVAVPPAEPPKAPYPAPVYKGDLATPPRAPLEGRRPAVDLAPARREIVPQEPTSGAVDAPKPSRAANQDVRQVAKRYLERTKVKSRRLAPATKVDEEKAADMARVYDELKSTPDDPEVKAAYRALAAETRDQAEEIQRRGYRFEFVDQDPYKTSKEMMEDVRVNRRLKVYRTAEGQQHPLLSREENDLFRAVHDFFGHAQEGNQFGPLGEERAFRDHSAMFSPQAARAMATETRGQNSWVNYGPQGKDLPPAERPFAAQKAALWPAEYMDDYPTMPVRQAETPKVEAPAPKLGDNTNLKVMGAGQAAGLALQTSEDEDVQRLGAGISAASGLALAPALVKQLARPTTRAAFKKAIAKSPDGFTFSLRDGAPVRDGWLVGGVVKKPMLVDELTPEVLDLAAKRFSKELAEDGVALGAWRNPKTGKIEVEPSSHFSNGERLQAIQAGVDRKQQAIGNLKAGRYNEEVLLKHHTENPDISILDPEFMGTGPHAGAERARTGRPASTHLYGMAANPEQQYEALPSVFSHAPKNQIVDLSPAGLKELTQSQPALAAEIKKARTKGADAMETVLAKRGLIYTVDGNVFKAFDVLPIFRKGEVPPGSRPLADVLKQQVEETAGRGAKLVQDKGMGTGKIRLWKTKGALLPSVASDEEVVKRAREVFLPKVLEGLEDVELATRMHFYSRRLVQANKEVVKRFPELRDPNKMGVYNLVRAMTSANSAPLHNEDVAMSAYARWRFGKVAPDLRYKKAGIPGNVSGGDWDRKLARLQADIEKFVAEAGGDEGKGLKRFNSWLLEQQEFPTSRMKNVGANPLPNARKYLSADATARKTTNYFMNLQGLSDRTTTDIWAVRSFRRAMGYYKEVLDPKAKKWVVDGSPEYHEYRLFERITEDLSSELRAMGYPETMTPREMQALLWFQEKRLALRAGAVDGGFEDYLSAWKTYPDRPWMGKVLDTEPGAGDLAMRPKDPKVANTKTAWERNVKNMSDLEALRRARWHAKEYGGTPPKKGGAKAYLRSVPPGQMAMYGGGAAVGAFLDEENRLRGAALGLGAEVGLRAIMKSKLAMKRGAKAAEDLGFPEVPKVKQEPVETPLQWQTKRKSAATRLRPLTSVKRYEAKLRAGEVGTPKSLEDHPSGILTPAMLALDPSGANFAKEIEDAAKAGRTRVTQTDEQAIQAANWLDANELLKDSRVARTSPELLALAAAAVRAKNAATKLTKEISEIRLGDTATLATKEAELSAALKTIDAAFVRMGQGASEAGRSLRMVGQLKFLAANVEDASFWVQAARKQAGIPAGAELDPKVLQGLEDALKNAPRDKDGLTKDGVEQLVRAVRKARPEPGLIRKFLELTKVGLLTLPGTHTANLIGNTAKASLDQGVVRPTAAFLDMLLTKVSSHGQRTSTTSSTARAGYRTGFGVGRAEALGSDALNSWRTSKSLADRARATIKGGKHVIEGMHDDNVVKVLGHKGIDWTATKGLNNGAGRVLNAYQGVVYGGLGAADKVFRQAAVHAHLAELAEVRAINAGLKRGTKEFDAAVQHAMSKEGVDPTDLAEAIFAGEMAVFTEPNRLADWVNQLHDWKPGDSELGANLLAAFAPFVRTPTNIVKQTLVDYNPLQMTRVLFGKSGALAKDGWRHNPAAQRKVVEAFGKGAVGAGLLAAGALLFLNDRITSAYKQGDQQESSRMRQSGKPYSSVKINGGWINVARLGPVGLMLVMGGELARGLEEGDNLVESGGRALQEGAKNIAELPMLQGTAELLKVLSGEKKARTGVLGQVAARTVPSIVGGIARGIDPVGDRVKESPLDYMWDRVPRMRETLEPKLSPLGDTTPGRSLATEIFLPGWRVERNDRVTKKLEELDVSVSDVQEDLTKETHAEFLRRRIAANAAARTAVGKAMDQSKFRRMSDEDQAAEIRRAISQARSRVTRSTRSGR